MNAYLPHDLRVFAVIQAIIVLELMLGFGISRLHSRRLGRVAAWLLMIVATVAVERLSDDEPAGERMLFLILPVLFGMKAAVAVESGTRLSLVRWLGFCVLWFGMRPALFEKAGGPPLSGAGELFRKGLARVAFGVASVAIAYVIWQRRESIGPDETVRWLATVPLAIGFSFILHFGIFNILAAMWRRLGVDCRTLWRSPIRSENLNEFWSKRWNLAFSEMTSLAIYRPVAASLGRKTGLVLAFLFSGLVHELAISVPVFAGYGRPTLYFLLHGGLIVIENRFAHAGRPIDRNPWLGRAWTLAVVVLPLPILFHRPFLAGTMWPILGMD